MPQAPKIINDLLEKIATTSLEVSAIATLSYNVIKLRFQGDISRMNFQVGYAVAIRVSDKAFRNYTIAYYNKAEQFVEIIFHLTEAGEGSRYIAHLKVGDSVKMTFPRGQKQYNPQIKKQVLFGDETSLGVACAAFQIWQKRRHDFQFYFELDACNSNLPSQLGLKNSRVFSKEGAFRNQSWIETLPFLKDSFWRDANFILTGNVRSVQNFRKALKRKQIFGHIYAKGYWLEGKNGL